MTAISPQSFGTHPTLATHPTSHPFPTSPINVKTPTVFPDNRMTFVNPMF